MQLASDAIAIVQPVLADTPVRIINKLQPTSPCVLGDPNRLQQIMLNLLSNALKHTERGEITISSALDGQTMCISITDTGSGIGESELANVFGVFSQSAADFGDEQGGMGLGLAITKRLIELHGGVINVSSTLKRGSVFTFTLPLAKPGAQGMLPPRQLKLTARSQTPKGAAQAQSTPSSEQVVLVVDDDIVNRMVLKGMLDRAYRVLEADDGKAAVELIERGEQVNLIVMDIMMPKMNGFEACKRIRRSYSKDSLPIIFVTARNVDEDLAVGFDAGGDDFLEKPVSKHKLLPRIKNLLPPPPVGSKA